MKTSFLILSKVIIRFVKILLPCALTVSRNRLVIHFVWALFNLWCYIVSNRRCDGLFYSSAVLINIPLVLIYGIILCLTGVVMYAYFANDGCDPLAEGAVTNGNQVKA